MAVIAVQMGCATDVQVNLKGERKSGTTFAEYYLRNLIALMCVGLDRDLQHNNRVTTCKWFEKGRQHRLSLYVSAKHALLSGPNSGFGAAGTNPIVKNCEKMSPEDLEKNCLGGVKAAAWVKKTTGEKSDKEFLLVLREPIANLKSKYYHATEQSKQSQEGLDAFVKKWAASAFANTAAFFLQHTKLVPQISNIWFYGESWDSVNVDFAEWFMIPESTTARFAALALNASSKDTMKALERIGELPTGGARTGKVRTKDPYDVSESVRDALLAEYKFTLPQELVDIWYGDEVEQASARKKVQSMLQSAASVQKQAESTLKVGARDRMVESMRSSSGKPSSFWRIHRSRDRP